MGAHRCAGPNPLLQTGDGTGKLEFLGWLSRLAGSYEEPGSSVAIYGFKNKVDREQIAFSLTKPQGHPSRLEELTRPLFFFDCGRRSSQRSSARG